MATPISLWDTASGRKLSTLPGAFAPFAFRPDGKALIAYADPSRLVAIDLATERMLWPQGTSRPLPGQWGSAIDFTPNGSTVLAERGADRGDDAGSAWLCRLNVLTGKERGEPLRGWGTIAVAPGGQLAAVGGRTKIGEAYIDLVDLPSGQPTASLRADAPVLKQLLFSPDRKSLYVCASEGDVYKGSSFFGRIWALGTQKAASLLMAHTGFGVYAPSADRLVTATENLVVREDRSAP
jgi:hypothetical protein